MIKRAFTLIELLIVVAIIAILAAIAVPNFLEAQTRAKVTRMESDMRTMAVAIEMYRVDHNKLPRQPPPMTCIIAKDGLPELTTPVSYISSIQYDIFRSQAGVPQPICYGTCTSGSQYWYVWSYGPDKVDQNAMLIYDPTNGTVSDGDIKRTTARDKLTISPE